MSEMLKKELVKIGVQAVISALTAIATYFGVLAS